MQTVFCSMKNGFPCLVTLWFKEYYFYPTIWVGNLNDKNFSLRYMYDWCGRRIYEIMAPAHTWFNDKWAHKYPRKANKQEW